MRRRLYRIGDVQAVGPRRRNLAIASRRGFFFSAQLVIEMSGSESIAPALLAIGLLCLVLPWADRENPWVRTTLVAASLIMTWHYLLWRITQTLPEFGFSADWLFGIGFLGTEVLTGIGGTITWIMLSRGSSRSATVESNMPWL